MSILSHCDLSAPPRRCTSASRFLNTPLPCKIPTKYIESSGKVLTSLENRKALEKKEKEKEKLRREKEERKAIREAKAKAKKKLRESEVHILIWGAQANSVWDTVSYLDHTIIMGWHLR